MAGGPLGQVEALEVDDFFVGIGSLGTQSSVPFLLAWRMSFLFFPSKHVKLLQPKSRSATAEAIARGLLSMNKRNNKRDNRWYRSAPGLILSYIGTSKLCLILTDTFNHFNSLLNQSDLPACIATSKEKDL